MMISLKDNRSESTRLDVYNSFNNMDELCFRHVSIVAKSEYLKYVFLAREDVLALHKHLEELLRKDGLL